MDRWVALLRGVNVGGVKVLGADLTQLFLAAGFTHVKAVQAAGNVLFDADARDGVGLRAQVEAALAARYGRVVPALVYRREQIAALVNAYPFERFDETTHPYVMMLEPVSAIPVYLAAADRAGHGGDVADAGIGVYWRCPRGQTLTSELAKVLGKTRGADVATNRNLRTLATLATM